MDLDAKLETSSSVPEDNEMSKVEKDTNVKTEEEGKFRFRLLIFIILDPIFYLFKNVSLFKFQVRMILRRRKFINLSFKIIL